MQQIDQGDRAEEVYTKEGLLNLLQTAKEKEATEILLKVPKEPMLRISGTLISTSLPVVRPQTSYQVAQNLCALAGIEIPLNSMTEEEFAFGVPGIGRFRVFLFRQRGSLAIIIRRSALDIPDICSFNLDPKTILPNLRQPGMLLISGGPALLGLQASLVELYNQHHAGFAVTVDQSIKYLHKDSVATIAQRGVGTDLKTKAAGIRIARHHGADLISVSEVEQADTALAALVAAEHRTTVIASISAPDLGSAPVRFLNLFGSAERSGMEQRLNDILTIQVHLQDDGSALCQ